MKTLGSVFMAGIVSVNAYCSVFDSSDFDSDFGQEDLLDLTELTRTKAIEYRNKRNAMPEEDKFREAELRWKDFFDEDSEGYNEIETGPLKSKLINDVEGDSVAINAMDLFLESKFWELVDYCADNLNAMAPTNCQKFKEILVLLAPGLYATRYIKKVTAIIKSDGHRHEIRQSNIKFINFCLDMYYYVAANNARRGRVDLANMCSDAFCALRTEGNKGLIDSYEIEEIFGDTLMEDDSDIYYFSQLEEVWPNWKQSATGLVK
jgi:hypothetical protein